MVGSVVFHDRVATAAAGCKVNLSFGIHILYDAGTHLGVDLSWQLAQVGEERLIDEPVLDLKRGCYAAYQTMHGIICTHAEAIVLGLG